MFWVSSHFRNPLRAVHTSGLLMKMMAPALAVTGPDCLRPVAGSERATRLRSSSTYRN